MPVPSRVIRSFGRGALVFAAAALVAALPVLAADAPASNPASQSGLATATDVKAAAKASFERMKQELKLTTEQQARIKPIVADNAKKFSDLLVKYQGKTGSEDLQKMRDEMRTIRQQTDDRLAKVLTPAQFEQWNKLRADIRQKAPDKEQKEAGPAPAAGSTK